MIFVTSSNAETDEWTKLWNSITARSLINSQVIAVDADTSVEDACEVSSFIVPLLRCLPEIQ